ncbi:MAG: hypothetical protein JO322_00415 [Candidatus Eremiobacteraeota bacterium]|nr:hypothetical protein [Candidatus Eremiobacteraeota bacterium]
MLMLAACSGGGGSSVTPPAHVLVDSMAVSRSASPSATPFPSYIGLYQGGYLGNTSTLWPRFGPDVNGGKGQAVDGYGCGSMADNSYHVHAWLGILVNGVFQQVPPGIGMVNPGAPTRGFYGHASCFYNIHTHDSDGYIHMEVLSTTHLSGTVFTLGNVLDMWGEQISPQNFGEYSGPVRVFVNRTPLAQIYTPIGGWQEITSATGLEWSTFPLYSHSAVIVEVGPTFVEAASLPQIKFYTQY